MKKVFTVAAIFLIVAIGLYFFFNLKKTGPSSEASSKQNSPAGTTENPPAPEKNSAGVSTVSSAGANLVSPSFPQTHFGAGTGAVARLPAAAAEIPPAIMLENVSRAVRQYGVMFGGNPVGTNPEITAALNGNNPKRINFIKPEAGMRVNENGELVDAWGTPFFFHQLSGTDMEIHSAGPDKIMWTADDLVSK